MEVFGFHTIDENFNSNEQKLAFCEIYYDVQNILNVLGWIPLVGTVSAGARIGSTIGLRWADPPENRERHRMFFLVSVLRGVVEFLSLGWVFVIPDIVITNKPFRYFKFQGCCSAGQSSAVARPKRERRRKNSTKKQKRVNKRTKRRKSKRRAARKQAKKEYKLKSSPSEAESPSSSETPDEQFSSSSRGKPKRKRIIFQLKRKTTPGELKIEWWDVLE